MEYDIAQWFSAFDWMYRELRKINRGTEIKPVNLKKNKVINRKKNYKENEKKTKAKNEA